MGSLSGKRGLVIGIASEKSIAYGCAQACQEQGAELAVTYLNDKALQHVRPLAEGLNVPNDLILPFDVTHEGDLDAVIQKLSDTWGKVDFIIHAMASATKAMTRSRLIDVPLEDFNFAMEVSCHSFLAVAKAAEQLLSGDGVIVTMTYLGGKRVMPHYQFMGPMKAALESCVRYVANELGPQNIRIHAISAGAIPTRAASGIEDLDGLLDVTQTRSPLGRLCTPKDVGALAAFLVSPAAGTMTGSIYYVDGGYNIMG